MSFLMSFFSNFSFRTKIISLCIFLCGISVTIGAISYNGLEHVGKSTTRITSQVMPKLEAANQMLVDYRQVRIALRTLGIAGITKKAEAEAVQATVKAIEHYEQADKTYTSLGFINGQKELYDSMSNEWKKFKDVGEKILSLQKSGTPESKTAMADLFFNGCPEAAAAYAASMTKLLDFHNGISKLRVAESAEASRKTNSLVLLVVSIGVIFGLSIGILFSSLVSKAILNVASALDSSSISVATESTHIASAAQELSQAATEQAASLQETSSAVEELSAMVTKNTESAKNTASTSSQSQEKANEGREAVEQMIQSMEEINQSNESIMNQIDASNQKMAEIVGVIQEIGNKTKVINEIVFQTKLLSFNASVEAARAGEHGKGFAVVAEEVGNLAQMSGNASKEISDMLDGSMKKVEEIVRDTKSQVEILVAAGKTKVETGVQVAKKCGDVLNEIVENVESVSGLSSEISTASQEQAQGISEINTAVTQLDQVTQQNAAATSQVATAAEQLSSQAEQMKSAVVLLMQTIKGKENSSSKSKASSPTKSAKGPSKSKASQVEKQTAKAVTSDSLPRSDDPGFSET